MSKAQKETASPNSGAKRVGICVELNAAAAGSIPTPSGSVGSTKHFPDGCKWRYARVLDFVMLEVLNSEGEVLFQTNAYSVLSVSGPGYTQPLWVSREYPTPAT